MAILGKDLIVHDRGTGHDEARVAVKFELEPLLAELTSESFANAQKAIERQGKADEISKEGFRLQAMKYSAATIVYAQTLVEAYFNWILQHRMLTHDDLTRRRLGQIVRRIRSPVSEKWLSLIEAVGFLATGKWIAVSVETRSGAEKLTAWRNYIVHYKAKAIPMEKLPRTAEGVVTTETEQQLTVDNAKEAIQVVGHLITELHRVENTDTPGWTSLLTAALRSCG